MKKNNYFVLFIFIISSFIGINSISFAEDNVNFSVSLKPSALQVGDDFSYYNLKILPKQEETLYLLVTNNGKEKLNLSVTTVNATTSQEGIIDYSKRDKNYKYDNTLKTPFTSITDKEQEISLEPNEQQIVSVTIKMPDTPVNGTILGGIVISPIEKKINEKKETSGIKIKNNFEIKKAVVLNNDDNKILPELKLNKINTTLINNTPATTINIQNTKPVMFGELNIETEVFDKKTGKSIRKQTNTDLEMAPNSNFDLPIFWNNQRLPVGEYTININATSGNENWKLTKDFPMTEESFLEFDDFYDTEKQITTPFWMNLLIITLIIVCIILFLVFIFFYKAKIQTKKRKKQTKL